MKIKIGQKIKLKSYEGYNDYRRRRGQTAIISREAEDFSGFDWRIEWGDGGYSYAESSNIIVLSTHDPRKCITL